MIKFESNMLVLNNAFSNEDVEEINAFAEYVREQERERIIDLLDSEHSEYTYQHQENKGAYIDDCSACFAIAIINGEN
jgi:hypothetical protein